MTIRISFSDKTVRVAVEINGAIESAITELPQRTWVGLTEAQCGVLWKVDMTPFDYYQAIEAKLKEKNT